MVSSFLRSKKTCCKSSGRSDEKLFEFTIKQAEQFVNNKTVEKLTNALDPTAQTKM